MESIDVCSKSGSSLRGWMQSTGQTSTQAESFVPMHGSVMMNGMSVSLQRNGARHDEAPALIGREIEQEPEFTLEQEEIHRQLNYHGSRRDAPDPAERETRSFSERQYGNGHDHNARSRGDQRPHRIAHRL